MSEPTRPRLVIIGPPGAGKTTVGTALATRWGIGFRDTDADIEVAVGKQVADIFIDDGEEKFRVVEAAAVRAALDQHDGVLALGGGAVVDPGTRAALAGHRVLFLDVGLAAAASRVGLGTSRPLLLGNVRTQLKTLLDARRPLYREVAWLTVSTDDLSVADVVASVEAALQTEPMP